MLAKAAFMAELRVDKFQSYVSCCDLYGRGVRLMSYCASVFELALMFPMRLGLILLLRLWQAWCESSLRLVVGSC